MAINRTVLASGVYCCVIGAASAPLQAGELVVKFTQVAPTAVPIDPVVIVLIAGVVGLIGYRYLKRFNAALSVCLASLLALASIAYVSTETQAVPIPPATPLVTSPTTVLVCGFTVVLNSSGMLPKIQASTPYDFKSGLSNGVIVTSVELISVPAGVAPNAKGPFVESIVFDGCTGQTLKGAGVCTVDVACGIN